jgi:hypothetical protein
VWDRSPQEAKFKTASPELTIENVVTHPGEAIKIPVWIKGVEKLYSSDIRLKYEQEYLEFLGLKFGETASGMYSGYEESVSIGFAVSQPIREDFRLAILEFKVKNNMMSTVKTDIGIESFFADEINCTSISNGGTVKIIKTNDESLSQILAGNTGLECYPNPFSQELIITYEIQDEESFVQLEILDLTGKVIKIITKSTERQGKHQSCWNGTDNEGRKVKEGLYLLRMVADDNAVVEKIYYSK